MAESSESPLVQYVIGIQRRWLLVALVAASLLAVLGPFAAGLPYIFQSKATLLVDQLPGVAQPGATGELDGRLQAIRQEALSRQRVTEMVDQFDLYPAMRTSMDDVMARFQRDANVNITSTSSIQGNQRAVAFTVSYIGSNAKTVADVANRLALFYVEKNDALRSKQVTQTAEFMRAQLSQVSARLDAQQQRMLAFTSTNASALTQRMGTTLAQYSTLTAQSNQFMGENARLTDRRDSLNTQIADLTSPRPTVGVPDQSDPAVRLATARQELATLKLTWADTAPQVIAKQNQITLLEGQVKARANGSDDDGAGSAGSRLQILQSQLAQVNADLAALHKNQEAVRAALAKYDQLFAEAPVRDAEFDKLSRDLSATRTEFEGLQRRLQEAVLNERAETTKTGEEFHILDPAMPSKSAAAPNKRALLVAALLISFGVAIGLAVGLEFLDSSFRSVEELRKFTHVPVLATIPRITTRRERWMSGLKKFGILAAALVALSFVAVSVFQVARGMEGVTRMLAR